MENATQYAPIVFLQNEDAQPALDMYRAGNVQGAIEYMKQWDMGEYYNTTPETGHGSADSTYEDGEYTAAFNTGMDYCSLEKKVTE